MRAKMKSFVILAQAFLLSQEERIATRETPLEQKGMKSPAKGHSARFGAQMFRIMFVLESKPFFLNFFL